MQAAGGPAASGRDELPASFPWKTGDAVLGAWRVGAISVGEVLRIALERGGERVTFVLSVPEGARPGALSASHEPTRVPAAEFTPAGRALVARLLTASGGDLRRFLRPAQGAGHASARVSAARIERRGDALRIDLPAAGDDGLLDSLDRLENKGIARVEILAARSGEPLTRCVERLCARGFPFVLLRLGPGALEPATLAALRPWHEKLRAEIMLDTLPARAGPGASLPGITAALDALRAAGVSAGVNYEIGLEAAGGFDVLSDLADVVLAKTGMPLHLALASVEHAKEHARPVPTFTDLAPLLEKAGAARKRFRLRSDDGTPLCLFPGDRFHALVPGDEREASRALAPERQAFGAGCAACLLRPACGGVSTAYAARFGTAELKPLARAGATARELPVLGWADKARLLLTDHPDERVRLGELLGADELPAWPCVLPWTRLELPADNAFGPCCADYLSERILAPPLADPQELWNSPRMQAIRVAMTGGSWPATCRRSCPVPASGAHRAALVTLRGGPSVAVESQITLVEDLLAGRTEVRAPPLELCLATTPFCNYRCVMCVYGQEPAHPDQELPASFYEKLSPWLDRMLTLDANGGEPLASATFRDFLERTDFAARPQLALHVTTNGSLLTPRQLARYGRLPFSSLTVSVNAATPATYLAVNRGLPMERLRENLDELLRLRREGRYACSIRYSMVVLDANAGEIRAFAEMARRDGVGVRFLLPTSNRNDQSIMDKPERMREATQALTDVREAIAAAHGDEFDLLELDGILQILRARLEAGQFETI